MTTVLIVEDEKTIRDGLVRAVGRAGHQVVAAATIAEARTALSKVPDCILLDIRLPDGDGLELLSEIRKAHPRLPVIMATAYGDSERAIAAMRAGAFEYITKPFDLEGLLSTVARAVRSSTAEPAKKHADAGEGPALIGASPRMLDVWKAVGRAAGSDAPVLITGESGVGKELVARAIHDNGARKGEPFVAINLAAVPATLIESELFGHEKGSFTGADKRREGRFELAARGTIFLDEIGDLDVALQSKLLRVLQEGTFERLGSGTPMPTHARVIAATSKPVDPRTPGVTLREDLFYRLGVIRIEVPPLRDRRSDIPLLVEGYLRRKAPGRAVSTAAMEKLTAHDWPGNVRELLHVVERACVMHPSELLDVDDFDIGARITQVTADPESLDLRAAIDALERDFVHRALKKAQGNRAEAARLLGIARPQLYAKMKQLGIDPDEQS
jgi:DNA-binding NtrC family response regulator